jgi:hypothetical protein
MSDLTNPVSVLMLVSDFRTEGEMQGILGFLHNSTGRYAHETVRALEVIGCPTEAGKLREILTVAEGAGATWEALQAQNAEVEQYEIVTLDLPPGANREDAWQSMLALFYEIDFDVIFERVESYVEQHRAAIENVITPDPDLLR